MEIKVSSLLDNIANSLESKGYIREAYEIDLIANTIDRDAGIIDIAKGFLGKFPKIGPDIYRFIKGKTPQEAIQSLLKALGGIVSDSDVAEAKKILSFNREKNAAKLFPNIRKLQRGLMTLLLLLVIGRMVNQSIEQMDASTINNFAANQSIEQIQPSKNL